MLEHVWDRVKMAHYLTAAVIATDDQRIYDAARSFGASVKMTAPTTSPYDRAEAPPRRRRTHRQHPGRRTLIDPSAIDAASCPHPRAASRWHLEKRIETARNRRSQRLKVVTTAFRMRSILAVHHPLRAAAPTGGQAAAHYKHIGLYVYRRTFCCGIRIKCRSAEEAERSSSCARSKTV